MAEPKQGNRRAFWLLVAFLAVAVVCALWVYRPRTGTAVAVISVDGQALRSIELDRAPDEVFSIEAESGKPVSFEVRDGAIRFVEVDCPDHLCERAGWCKAPGQRAVCMPNRTALVCYEPDEVEDVPVKVQ